MLDVPRLPGGDAIQIFTLQPGYTSLTSTDDPVHGVRVIHCVSDGQLSIVYSDGTPETISFVENNQFGFEQAAKVTIVSGTFHFMV